MNSKKIKLALAGFIIFFACTSLLAQYTIIRSTFGGGCGGSAGGDYALCGTAAQTAVGVADNSTYNIHSGFQQVVLHYTPVEEERMNLPRKFEMFQNYPNPFNPQTSIKYTLPKAAQVKIEVYNILGQRVATLVDEVKKAGTHIVTFNAAKLASGLYIYTIRAKDFYAVKKMIVTK